MTTIPEPVPHPYPYHFTRLAYLHSPCDTIYLDLVPWNSVRSTPARTRDSSDTTYQSPTLPTLATTAAPAQPPKLQIQLQAANPANLPMLSLCTCTCTIVPSAGTRMRCRGRKAGVICDRVTFVRLLSSQSSHLLQKRRDKHRENPEDKY